jgi:signal peptide peptidase SppA
VTLPAAQLETLTAPRFARVTDYVGPWAIEPLAGRSLWELARGKDLFAHVELQRVKAEAGDDDATPTPKAAIELQPDGRGKSVATVRVEGTLMKRSSSLGGSGTVQMRRDIRQAANDPEVSAILLAVDSPGGTVAGTDELAQEVRSATKKKPVMAYVSDLCASAAYWVASQADAIYLNSETALVGSIGTLMTVYDVSKAAAEAGIEAIVFATGPLKGAGTEGAPISEEQRAYFQSIVDSAQGSFDAAVKRGRNLTDAQLKAVRTGGVFSAAEAEGRKLVDGVKTYDQVFGLLVKEAYSRNRSARPAVADSIPGGVHMTLKTATASEDVVDPKPAAVADAADPVAETRRRVGVELRRQAAIQAIDGASRQPAIVAEAIEQGWSAEKAELHILRANLPKGITPGNPHGGGSSGGAGASSGSPVDADVLTAALCLELRVSDKVVAQELGDKADRVMNTVMSSRFRGFTLRSALGAMCDAAGKSVRAGANMVDLWRAARESEHDLRASGGFSNVSLAGILGAVANKVGIDAYTSVSVVWNQICAIGNNPDFKAVTRYRLDAGGAVRRVGPDGELKSMTLSEAAYATRLETFGATMALNRQQIVNDDLDSFAQLPRIMFRESAIRIEEGVFVTLLGNAGSFFASGNRNLLTGAGSALSITNLTASEALFMNQVSPNGKAVNVAPAILLAGTALKATAESIFRNEKIVSTTTANAPLPDNNPFFGRFRPVVSGYLNNTNLRDESGVALSGQSATQWYLFADPSDRAALRVAFLNGQQTPTLENADTDFNTLGMQWRIFHDFAFGFEDFVAAQRNAGA